MKKLLGSLAILLLPAIAFGVDDPSLTVRNTYSFNQNISTIAAANPAWQVYNSSASRKRIYIERVDVGGDTPALFVLYSTNVINGFTGTQVRVTATPMHVSRGTSVSTCTYTTSATLPTGDTLWQGVALASTTFSTILQNPIAIPSGYALYVVATKPAAGKVFCNFYFKEEYEP